MPVSYTDGEFGYTDIRVGTDHNIHQISVDPNDLASASEDYVQDGTIPPGVPLQAAEDGTMGVHAEAVSGPTDVVRYVTGPEPHCLAYDPIEEGATPAISEQVNVYLDGALNRDAIEFNLGRALDANEEGSLELSQQFNLFESGPTAITTT